MGKWRPKVCKDCEAKAADGVELSTRGLCRPCAATRVRESIEQMANQSGPYADKWQAAMTARFGSPAPPGVVHTPPPARPTRTKRAAAK